MGSSYDQQKLKEVQDFFNISGNSLNTSRKFEDPRPQKKMEDTEDSLMKGIPKMDLMNFEDPQFEEGKYVLTSPRSLEACSRLGVKPVDLLYKPLAEFQEELLPQDVPLRTIYSIYDEHERNRERKLALCREERMRIMDEGKRGTKEGQRKPTVMTGKNRKADTTSRVHKPQTRKARLAGKKSLSKSDPHLDTGSLQRKRTAWATSVGHERITKDEINQRVKELHDESVKMRQELLTRREARATKSSVLKKKKNIVKRPSSARPASARASVSRSFSASDLSLAGTSMLNKTNISEARPISSQRLQKALRKSGAKSTPITPRDEKILSLMMSKHEEEQMEGREKKQLREIQWERQKKENDEKILSLMMSKHEEEEMEGKEKQLREIQWERQKKEEEAAHLASEMRRRRLLAEENRIKKAKKTDQTVKKKEDEEKILEEQEKLLDESRRKWEERFSSLQKHKTFKMADKIEKEQLKKRIQESNVKALEKEEAEMKELVKQRQDYQILTAAQKKEARLLEESMRAMMKNRTERRQFEDRWNSLLKDTQESIDLLSKSMEVKDSKHKMTFDQIQQRRENELTLNKLDREKKLLQAKLAQQQQESEMEEWRDSVLASREIADKHAKETLAQTIERKARKAHEDRVRKEKEQKKNIKKIKQEVESYQKQMEEMIETKDKKSELIQKEKDFTIQQSRHLAATSQKLRDTLRNKYGGETFDQKVKKAEMYNKFEMGTTFLSSQKNTSRVKIN